MKTNHEMPDAKKISAPKAMWRKVRSSLHRMVGSYSVNLGGQSFICDPESWRFWRNVNSGKWEEHTLKILRTVLQKDDHYLDVGSWIGPTALYASRFCKKVYCLEPDPVAYELLLKNIRLNNIKNILTAQFGLFTENKTLTFGSPQGLGTSGSSLLYSEGEGSTTIQCRSLADIQAYWSLPYLKLIKIDIEGAEFDILPKIKDAITAAGESVYLSTHCPHFSVQERREKMNKLKTFFSMYSHIYDDNLRLIQHADVEKEEYLGRYSEFLCTTRALPELTV